MAVSILREFIFYGYQVEYQVVYQRSIFQSNVLVSVIEV